MLKAKGIRSSEADYEDLRAAFHGVITKSGFHQPT